MTSNKKSRSDQRHGSMQNCNTTIPRNESKGICLAFFGVFALMLVIDWFKWVLA